MALVRSVAVQDQLALDAARIAVVATRLAEVMGLFQRPEGRPLDRSLVGEAIRAVAAAGIGDQVAARLDADEPGEATLRAFLHALESSPHPTGEIPALAGILGYPALEPMVGASEASLRRYALGARPTPDAVAGRLHHLAEVVAILRGSFNEFGIRRWFERPNPALARRSPAILLTPAFDPDGRPARSVRSAALRLLW